MDYSKLLYGVKLRAIAIELATLDLKTMPAAERDAFIEKQDFAEYVKRAHYQVVRTLSVLDDQKPNT